MLGLLPWERWLHPLVYGPLLAGASIWALHANPSVAWWEWLLLGAGAVFGIAGSLHWLLTRRNLFDPLKRDE